jgi:predicted trehalose synthase
MPSLRVKARKIVAKGFDRLVDRELLQHPDLTRAAAVEKIANGDGEGLYRMHAGMARDAWALPAEPESAPVRKSAVEIEVERRADRVMAKGGNVSKVDALASVLNSDLDLYDRYRQQQVHV